MNSVIEVRVIQSDGTLSKGRYTYIVSQELTSLVMGAKEAYLPMRGKDVLCQIESVYNGEAGEIVLNNLNYPRDKVIVLESANLTLGIKQEEPVEKEDADDSFKNFLK